MYLLHVFNWRHRQTVCLTVCLFYAGGEADPMAEIVSSVCRPSVCCPSDGEEYPTAKIVSCVCLTVVVHQSEA
jgi:hypothetical protein